MPEQAFAFVAGDTKPVSIGRNTNLQDGVFVGTLNPAGQDTKVGSNVSVGHGAVLQGCTVEDNTLIGMNAILQAGSKVGVCYCCASSTCYPRQHTLHVALKHTCVL